MKLMAVLEVCRWCCMATWKSLRISIKPETDVLVLHSASIVESFRGETKPSPEALVAIVSRWPEFLRWARTLLVAAGLDADALSFRDARERNWEKGLRSAAFVITDSLMAPRIPGRLPGEGV